MARTNNFPATAPRQNTLVAALAQACRTHLLAEKWLVAPSRRIGQQWLEAIARAGQPLVNVRLHTVTSLALEIAGPGLADSNRQLLSPTGRVILVADLLRQLSIAGNSRSRGSATLRNGSEGGAAAPPRTTPDSAPGYLTALRPSLTVAERIAGTLRDLRLAGLEAEDLARGEFEVAAKGGEILTLLQAYRRVLDEKCLVDEADLLRRAMGAPKPSAVVVLVPGDLELEALERQLIESLPGCVVLPVDEAAPVTTDDAFSAVGAMNEVREVLRRCLVNGWPLDEVELLHADAATYVPVVYELSESLTPKIPATFAEGIPVRYARPGRALAAFLRWVGDDYPQPALVAMVRDGLLAGIPAKLAATLRPIPIGFGQERYREQLAGHPLWPALEKLLAVAARPPLEAATCFLRDLARCGNELDNYTREALLERLAEFGRWNGPAADAPVKGAATGATGAMDASVKGAVTVPTVAAGFGLRPPDDALVRDFLQSLLADMRVQGLGPRPGHLHVAGIDNGGHSGRAHTFILGLDSGRFPAAGRQDPVLLDSERATLSAQLATAGDVRIAAAKRFERLRARLRGTVTLSYSCRDMGRDAELFASPAIPKGIKPGTGTLAPSTEAASLSPTEWWLWRLCAGAPVVEPSKLVGECFPRLGRGLVARRQRACAEFTEFDGFVPEAGPELDPVAGRLWSAHALEKLGACPLRYFFHYGLGLEEPEELELDPHAWLPAADFGLLLHDVFCRHLKEGAALDAALAERIEHYRGKFPPPSEGVFRRERRKLERAIRVFAAEEAEWTGRAIDFEREIEDVPVTLPDGTVIRARGRIDRVDETDAGLVIWDYKTGSTFRFRPATGKDPFVQGRLLQHALYVLLAQAHYGTPVAAFGYFFPTDKGRGERIVFKADTLAGAPAVLAKLRQLIATGTFPATTKTDDCTFCDFRCVCGDVERVVAESAAKQGDVLRPFRELRE